MNITVRQAMPSDAPRISEIFAFYVKNTAISFEREVPSAKEFSARIENTLKKYPFFVAEKDNEIVGYTYAGRFKTQAAYDWSVETSIYIKEENKRAGIGTMLYDRLEDALKKQGILNLNACIAYTDVEDAHLTNDSVAFHEKYGYRLVAHFHECGYKFNRWYDMVWMEKMLGEHLPNQPKVKPFCEI